jgi:hypothetical protein
MPRLSSQRDIAPAADKAARLHSFGHYFWQENSMTSIVQGVDIPDSNLARAITATVRDTKSPLLSPSHYIRHYQRGNFHSQIHNSPFQNA